MTFGVWWHEGVRGATRRLLRAVGPTRYGEPVSSPSLLGDADDRAAGDAPLRGEGGGCLGQRLNGADPHLEPSFPESPGEVGEACAVGFHDEEEGPPVVGAHGGRVGDRDERAAGAHERGRAFEYVAADHVEHHVDLACVLPPVGLQVEERVRAQAEDGVPVGGAARADDAGSASRASWTAIEPTPPAAP